MQKENKLTRNFIIGTFVTLYVMVSLISTIHVIDFFELSNPRWLAITLAVAFEVGAAASLASIIALKKMNKGIVWVLFFILTGMQAMGNAFFAYTHLNNYQSWIELFGLVESDLIEQKRILSLVSGAILPLVALGFIKSLVDYIRPDEGVTEGVTEGVNSQITDAVTQSNLNEEAKKVWEKVDELRKEGKLPEITEDDLINEPTALANSQYSEMDFEEDSLLDVQDQIVENVETPEVETEDDIAKEDINTEEDKEDYPVYDNSNEVAKNNAIENIMVFTKNGNQ
jgi:hypothetical protein